MKFSIIVPVYNVEAYLEECLNSILSEEIIEYELILIDDGSTDNSGVICDKFKAKYQNKRIKVIHKKNGGLSDARNVGLQLARGEYIVFIDSDDLIIKNSLRILNEAITNAGYPDILITRQIERYENGLNKEIDTNLNFCSDKNSDEIIKKLCNFSKSFCPVQRYIVKRELILSKNLFFKKGYYHEDLDWTINLLIIAKTYEDLQKPWYIYRMGREGSITSSYSIGFKRIMDVLEIAKEGINRVESSELSKTARKVLCERIAASVFSILILYNSCDKTGKIEVEKYLRTCKNIFQYSRRISHILFVKVSFFTSFRLGFMLKNIMHKG